jgi:hypothetical protein
VSIFEPIFDTHLTHLWRCDLSVICLTSRWTLPLMTDSERTSTAFNRLKRYWNAAYLPSLEKLTKTRIDHNNDDGRIQISCRRNGIHVTTMAELRELVLTVLARLQLSLHALFPGSFELPDISKLVIVDDTKDPQSFLDRPELESVLDPIQRQIWKALCTIGEKKHHLFRSDGTLDEEAAEKYLELEQQFLCCFAFVLIWLCGKPPRSYQAVNLRYRPSGNDIRNWHMFSGLSALGWPQQKSRPGQPNMQHTLLILPNAVTPLLIVYLGIMRRISISILRLLGQSSHLLATHIFVNTIPGPSCGNRWTSSQFTTGFRAILPSNLAHLDDRNLGDLFTNIVRHQIPELDGIIKRSTKPFESSLLNTQGGHDENTTAYNYGLDEDIYHFAFNISSKVVIGLVTICQVWQALWELIRLDEDWVCQLFATPTFVAQGKKPAARCEAQILVLSKYLLNCNNSDSRRQAVPEILSDLRFTKGLPMSPTIVSGFSIA